MTTLPLAAASSTSSADIERHRVAVGAQPLERAGLAAAQAVDQAARDVHLLGDALGDLMLQRRQVQLGGQLFGDVLGQEPIPWVSAMTGM